MAIRETAYPRQVILVTSRAEVKIPLSAKKEVKDNIMTLSWHSPISFNPELYAIVIGKERYSYDIIKESKVFIVNFMPIELKKEVLFCGRNSGIHIDKFNETGLEKEEAETIDCARIKQALACLECEVVNEVEAGDHVIIIGKVLKTVEHKKGKKVFQKSGDNFTTTL
jgi:flavin reductase (DIM6/NTAB) family NADH-FMN oxidoreductase RutF